MRLLVSAQHRVEDIERARSITALIAARAEAASPRVSASAAIRWLELVKKQLPRPKKIEVGADLKPKALDQRSRHRRVRRPSWSGWKRRHNPLGRDGIGEPSPVQSTRAKFNVILNDQHRRRRDFQFST